MSKSCPFLRRIAGGIVALLAGSVVGAIAAGLLANLVYRDPDHPDEGFVVFMFFVLLCVPAGAITGAAGGATIVQKPSRWWSSFWRAFLGALLALPIGLVAGGLMPGLCSWAFSESRVWGDGVIPVIVGICAVCVTIGAGVVIGSGWRAEPADPTSP